MTGLLENIGTILLFVFLVYLLLWVIFRKNKKTIRIVQTIFGGIGGAAIGAVALAAILCFSWGKGYEAACIVIGAFTFPIGMAAGVVPGIYIMRWYLKKGEIEKL